MVASISKICLVLVLLVKCTVNATNYCDANLCPKKGPHIACNNNGQYSSACGSQVKLVPMDQKMKNYILSLHNSARSRTALGKLPGFPPARKMPLLRWSNELANLAELNVKTCKYGHDSCRNTDKYRFAGQNIFRMSSSPDFHPVKSTIKRSVNLWFNEYKDASPSIIQKYVRTNGPEIGHFTAMVNDRVTEVGCAAVMYVDSKQSKVFLFTCDYSYTNVLNKPVYSTGATGSSCTRGLSKYHKGLCL